MNAPKREIELLAPARDLSTGKAAVDSGADALYIGGARFGARCAAGNSTQEIAELVRYAHTFGVRVHATLNTILYEQELQEAERTARELCEAGVDALIVQDMAFRRMDLPGVELHASTQTCNTTPEGVRFLEASGFSRVILERGLTLDEIRAIRSATTVPLECFVHGAICVGFSGQCYLSRSQSPRSGNRGECSQSCRLPYDLTDGSGKTILRGRHLLSVRDLNLSDRLEELIDAGIASFKIEGRLKETSYVRNVVAYYRRELDRIIGSRDDLKRSSAGTSVPDFEPDPAKSFTRGFTRYFFDGKNAPYTGQQPGAIPVDARLRGSSRKGDPLPSGNFIPGVASFDTPKAVGEEIGRVAAVGRDWFTLGSNPKQEAGNKTVQTAATHREHSRPTASRKASEWRPEAVLSPGDGICFLHGDTLSGTNINRSEGDRIYPNRMDGITPGVILYRNYDHRFTLQVERSRTRRTIAADARLEILQGHNISDIRTTGTITDITGVNTGNSIPATAPAGSFTEDFRTDDLAGDRNGMKPNGESPVRLVLHLCDEQGVEASAEIRGEFSPAQNEEKMRSVMQAQLSKCGDTVFTLRKIGLPEGPLPFVPASVLNDLRRTALDKLACLRAGLRPAADPRTEERSFPHPSRSLDGTANVVNSLSGHFYRDHGVQAIAPGIDLKSDTKGERVMLSSYCLRRELGQCLQQKHTLQEPLYLKRGDKTYRLRFDCAACRMALYDETDTSKS